METSQSVLRFNHGNSKTLNKNLPNAQTKTSLSPKGVFNFNPQQSQASINFNRSQSTCLLSKYKTIDAPSRFKNGPSNNLQRNASLYQNQKNTSYNQVNTIKEYGANIQQHLLSNQHSLNVTTIQPEASMSKQNPPRNNDNFISVQNLHDSRLQSGNPYFQRRPQSINMQQRLRQNLFKNRAQSIQTNQSNANMSHAVSGQKNMLTKSQTRLQGCTTLAETIDRQSQLSISKESLSVTPIRSKQRDTSVDKRAESAKVGYLSVNQLVKDKNSILNDPKKQWGISSLKVPVHDYKYKITPQCPLPKSEGKQGTFMGQIVDRAKSTVCCSQYGTQKDWRTIVKDKHSFPKEQKTLYTEVLMKQKKKIPGPACYEYSQFMKKRINGFYKNDSPRISQFDDTLAVKSHVPAPSEYEPKKGLSESKVKGFVSIGKETNKSTSFGRFAPQKKDKSPGPGSYDVENSVTKCKLRSTIQQSIGKEKLKCFIDKYTFQSKSIPSTHSYKNADKPYDYKSTPVTSLRRKRN